MLTLAHAMLQLSAMTRLLWSQWMPVPLAVMLGIMKVCSIPSQKDILVSLTLTGCSFVATAMWELNLVRPLEASPVCRTRRPPAPFITLCGRVTDPE